MLKNKLLPIAAFIGAGFLPLAQAADQIQDDRWYVAPFASYIHSGGARKASDGWGGGMGFGKMVDQYFNFELRGFYQGASGQQGHTWNMSGGTADLQIYFFRDKFSPYAVLGTGGMDTCFGSKCTIGFIGEAGLGFTYEITDNILFRSDVRYRLNINEGVVQRGTDDYNDMVVNAGFVIPFGDKPKAAAKKVEAPVIPAPAPKIAPAPVDCSTLDSDHDGVNDCLDKCPNTVKGSKVDSYGCPIKLILKGSNFKHDSAVLTPEARAILSEVAQSLNAYPDKNPIDVNGYTSSEGSDSYNFKLSQRRASSVVDFLKSKGVTNQLTAKGYGKAKPIADNRTEAGISENRRVELIWIEG